MQFKQEFLRRSEEEYIKDEGLIIDYDEIARKGKMNKGEVLISKWYGVYQSRQPGNHMARIVISGGKITSAQARAISRISEKYAQGKLSVTTRQAIQLHWLKLGALPDFFRELAAENLSCFHGCGDVTRIIAACPLAETCRYRRINVMPHTVRTAKLLTDSRDLDNLPRKFKITFSGCGANCAQPYMNCVGNIAVNRKVNGKTETGFKVVIGGGMGWQAFVAQELFSFVPEEHIHLICRGIALLYRDHGDRFNRQKSRLKFVVDRLGIDQCREIVLDFLKKENVPTDRLEWKPFEEAGEPFPERPLIEQDPVGTDGKVTVRIIVPQGELNFRQFLRIAELSEIYGNQRVYTDNRQNLSIHGVDPSKVKEVKAEIEKLGFSTGGYFGLHDIVTCVGTTYCPKAVTETRALYDLLKPVVQQKKYEPIEYTGIINITGCPNSCSPYRISDLGFRGERIREEIGSVEGYEMLIAGHEQDHGRKLGEFKKNDIPGIVEKILDDFLKNRKQDEFLRDYLLRMGVDAVREVIEK